MRMFLSVFLGGSLAIVVGGCVLMKVIGKMHYPDRVEGRLKYDDSDPMLPIPGTTRLSRSGMEVATDAQTGRQYLVVGGLFGRFGITPRIDKDGKHMRVGE